MLAGVLRLAEASFDVVLAIVARGLLFAVCVAIVYVALEPFLRRHWPSTMISWSRLQAGRWRDPLVGRDVLVGLCAGVLIALLSTLSQLAPKWLGVAPELAPPGRSLQSLMGARFAVAALLSANGFYFLISLGIVLLFFVLAQILRRRWLAAAVFFSGLTAIVLPQGPLTAAFAVLLTGVVIGLMLRFGLLAQLASGLSNGLVVITMTLDASSWYAPSAWMFVLLYVGLAAYACRVALAGRPVFSGAFLDD